MIHLFCALCGYLAGSIPFAYIAGRLKGKDLTRVGSGNLGTSNVFHEVGKAAGVLVFFADCAKIALPILTARLLGAQPLSESLLALGAIAGHNWSVFTGFKGGRGMSLTLIGSAFLLPRETLVILAILGFGFFTKTLALYGGVSLATWPLLAVFFGQPGTRVFFSVGALALGALRRLQGSPDIRAAKEKKYVRKRDLIINRLLFDRETPDTK